MDDEVIVTLSLEDGTELECTVIGVYEAGGRDYIALQPADDEEADVLLYRYLEDDIKGPGIDMIESDEEYEIASDGFDEWLDSLEFDELAGDDE